jgi:hypothetical protein
MAAVQAPGDIVQFTVIACLSLSFQKLKTEKATVLFFPSLPNFQNSIAFFTVARFRPFVQLVKVTLWSFGGMILTGETGELASASLCTLSISRGLTWYRPRPSWFGAGD